MTIEVPDTYAVRFDLFDKIERVLHEAWQSDGGVSRMKIGQLFGTVCMKGGGCWNDPAFIIWAGLKGVACSGDFFKMWKAESGVVDEDEEEQHG